MKKNIVWLLFIFIIFACPFTSIVQAQTFTDWLLPAFEITSLTKDSAVQIIDESISVETLETSKQTVKIKSAYTLHNPSSENANIKIALPYVGNAIGDTTVKIDGVNADWVRGYGQRFLALPNSEIDLQGFIENTFFPVIPEGKGTLYSFEGIEGSLSVSLKLQSGQALIHSGFNALQQGLSGITIGKSNLSPEWKSIIFITNGDLKDEPDCSSAYSKAEMTYADFLAYIEEIFSEADWFDTNFARAQLNKIVSGKGYITDLFDFLDDTRGIFNLVSFETDFAPSQTRQIEVTAYIQGRVNYGFTPEIYCFDFVTENTFNKDRNFSLEFFTSQAIPYIIESNLNMTKGADSYSFSSTQLSENFYFVLCSVDVPTSNSPNNDTPPNNKFLIIYLSIAIPICTIIFAITVVVWVRYFREKKKEKNMG